MCSGRDVCWTRCMLHGLDSMIVAHCHEDERFQPAIPKVVKTVAYITCFFVVNQKRFDATICLREQCNCTQITPRPALYLQSSPQSSCQNIARSHSKQPGQQTSQASAAIGTHSASMILLYSDNGLLKSEFFANVAGPVMRLPYTVAPYCPFKAASL